MASVAAALSAAAAAVVAARGVQIAIQNNLGPSPAAAGINDSPVFEICQAKMLEFPATAKVISTDANLEIDTLAPPGREDDWLNVAGHHLHASIAASRGPNFVLGNRLVLIESSFGIPRSRFVILVNCPPYDPAIGRNANNANLATTYDHMLAAMYAFLGPDGERLNRIAIPIMGAGELGYGSIASARIAVRKVMNFFTTHNSADLHRAKIQHVSFIVEDDPECRPAVVGKAWMRAWNNHYELTRTRPRIGQMGVG